MCFHTGLSAVSDPRPILWDTVEKEQCAKQFSYFEERPSLFPDAYNGSIPGPEAEAQVLCVSQEYNFTALFGPWQPNGCQQKKVGGAGGGGISAFGRGSLMGLIVIRHCVLWHCTRVFASISIYMFADMLHIVLCEPISFPVLLGFFRLCRKHLT